jgi:8-hydroxy-5-deazaflavin:NADPH oxidoreductase
MKIAIIGTGNVGSALAKRWARGGHTVVLGTRDASQPKVTALVKEPGVQAAAPAKAAQDAEVVVLATPWNATEAAVRGLGDLKGKVVIDATNPIGEGFTLAVSGGSSAAELVAGWAPGARVVKAFNMTGSGNMLNPAYPAGPAAMFVCGDDDEARGVALGLAKELGFDAIDAGKLDAARLLEPMALLWVRMAYAQGMGPNVAYGLLRR